MGFLSLGLGRVNARKTDLQGFERHRGCLVEELGESGVSGCLGEK